MPDQNKVPAIDPFTGQAAVTVAGGFYEHSGPDVPENLLPSVPRLLDLEDYLIPQELTEELKKLHPHQINSKIRVSIEDLQCPERATHIIDQLVSALLKITADTGSRPEAGSLSLSIEVEAKARIWAPRELQMFEGYRHLGTFKDSRENRPWES